MNESNSSPIEVPERIYATWQSIVDNLAALFNLPAALVMRIVDADIEVFVSSSSEGNPYRLGAKERLLGSGLYCETVIRQTNRLLVPDALSDPDWKDNPDVKLDMISYLGFPILFPDGKPFGTICVLDNKRNSYSETAEALLSNFRKMIEGDLELLYMNQALGDTNKELKDYVKELKVLRGILPICSFCKRIKDEGGDWLQLEVFVRDRSEAEFSHGFCPECAEKWMDG